MFAKSEINRSVVLGSYFHRRSEQGSKHSVAIRFLRAGSQWSPLLLQVLLFVVAGSKVIRHTPTHTTSQCICVL